jgi:hypothetical protein
VIDLGIQPDWPGQDEDYVADDIGVPVRAWTGEKKPDDQQRDPDHKIEADKRLHGFKKSGF